MILIAAFLSLLGMNAEAGIEQKARQLQAIFAEGHHKIVRVEPGTAMDHVREFISVWHG